MEQLKSSSADVQAQLQRLLGSEFFRPGTRSGELLRYLVETALAGNGESLKEYSIGADALGRGAGFDPRIDSIVRVEMARLRTRLDQYYATLGSQDPIRICLPKGSYVPRFHLLNAEVKRTKRSWSRLQWATVGLTLVGVVCLGWLLPWRPVGDSSPRPQTPLRLEVKLMPKGELANVVGSKLALSPDGRSVVFTGKGPDGGSQLFVRHLDADTVTPIVGTEGGRGAVFSPDSQWVAFWAERKLKKVLLSGGAPIVLAEASDLLGAAWGDDGYLVASLQNDGKLWRIPESGGRPEVLVDTAPEPVRVNWPQVLPGSQVVLFSKTGALPDSGSVEALSVATASRKTLVKQGGFGRYLPSGHLVYLNQGNLYAQRFDPRTLEATSPPVVVLQHVDHSPFFGYAHFEVAQNGLAVFRRAAGRGEFTLASLYRDGRLEPLVDEPGRYLWPRISPDRKHVAFLRTDGGQAVVWLLQIGSKKPYPLRGGTDFQVNPTWTPDGRGLILSTRSTLDWVPLRAEQPAYTILRPNNICVPWSWSPDGRWLTLYRLDPDTHFDLWALPMQNKNDRWESGDPHPIVQTQAVETYPAISPDGKWLSYTALRNGRYDVFVRPFGKEGEDVQVSPRSGRLASWAKDVSQLIFETEDHGLMVADYRVVGGRFVPGPVRPWSEVRLGDTGVLPNFDVVSANEVIALLPAPGDEQEPNHVTLIQDFFGEIERKLSTARQ